MLAVGRVCEAWLCLSMRYYRRRRARKCAGLINEQPNEGAGRARARHQRVNGAKAESFPRAVAAWRGGLLAAIYW